MASTNVNGFHVFVRNILELFQANWATTRVVGSSLQILEQTIWMDVAFLAIARRPPNLTLARCTNVTLCCLTNDADIIASFAGFGCAFVGVR